MQGYIYVLSNPSMPGLYKIGRTSETVQKRIAELSSCTSIPTPFEEEYSLFVPDMCKAESLLHKELAKYRTNPNKEFFKTDLETIEKAFACIHEIYGDYVSDMYEDMRLCGNSHYKRTYKNLLNSNHKVLMEKDYKIDSFSNVYLKDGLYFYVELAYEMCTEEEFLSWVEQKKLENALIG